MSGRSKKQTKQKLGKKTKKKIISKKIRKNPLQTYTSGALFGLPKIIEGKWYVGIDSKGKPLAIRLVTWDSRNKIYVGETSTLQLIRIKEKDLIEGPFELQSQAKKYL